MPELRRVQRGQKEILRNLLEKYNYEFSQYTGEDVNELGLFGYDWLDGYWTEPDRYPYLIYEGGNLAGFVLVNDHPEDETRPCDFSVAEFFVLYKYRRQGIGAEMAKAVFDLHHGHWQVKLHPHNLPSVHFWNKVIGEYTKGSFELVSPHRAVLYEDGTNADMYFFKN